MNIPERKQSWHSVQGVNKENRAEVVKKTSGVSDYFWSVITVLGESTQPEVREKISRFNDLFSDSKFGVITSDNENLPWIAAPYHSEFDNGHGFEFILCPALMDRLDHDSTRFQAIQDILTGVSDLVTQVDTLEEEGKVIHPQETTLKHMLSIREKH